MRAKISKCVRFYNLGVLEVYAKDVKDVKFDVLISVYVLGPISSADGRDMVFLTID